MVMNALSGLSIFDVAPKSRELCCRIGERVFEGDKMNNSVLKYGYGRTHDSYCFNQ